MFRGMHTPASPQKKALLLTSFSTWGIENSWRVQGMIKGCNIV
jgi:hypothetical protein